MLISKSEYMLYLKHPAWLWIKKHAKHLMPPIDDDLQARFNEGHVSSPQIMYHFSIEFLELVVSCLGLGEGGCDCTALAMH